MADQDPTQTGAMGTSPPPPPPAPQPPPVERAGKFVLWAVVFVALVGLLVFAVHRESVALFLFGLAAIGAYLILLAWPQRAPAWNWFTSKPVAILTAVLSISGAAGGFAFHLVSNHGAILLIGYRHVKVAESYPSPATTPPRTESPGGKASPSRAEMSKPAAESAPPSAQPTASSPSGAGAAASKPNPQLPTESIAPAGKLSKEWCLILDS